MRKVILIAFLIGVAVVPQLLLAASKCSRYVASTGSDMSGCGTSSKPCATIAYVDANIVSAGDTVCVAAGTYTGSFQTSRSGTLAQRIRFISYPQQWGAVLVGQSTTGTDGTSTWQSSGDYVDIVGFDVTASSSSQSPAIGILNYGKYDRVMGNKVHDFTTPCDSFGGAGIDDAIENTVVNGWGYSQFISNFIYNIQPQYGMSECNARGYNGTFPPAIYLQWPYASAMDNLIVNTPFGIEMYHDTFDELVVNNTVRCPSANSPIYTIGVVVSAQGVTDNWTLVTNNITDGCTYGIQEEAPTGGKNDYLNNDDYNSTYPLTIVGGGAQSGNITSNPLFVNDTGNSSGDYHLQSGSPARDAGANYAFAPFVDFAGGVRPDTSTNKWDMGAYEYGSSAVTWPWL